MIILLAKPLGLLSPHEPRLPEAEVDGVRVAVISVRRDIYWKEVFIFIARGEDASRVFMDFLVTLA